MISGKTRGYKREGSGSRTSSAESKVMVKVQPVENVMKTKRLPKPNYMEISSESEESSSESDCSTKYKDSSHSSDCIVPVVVQNKKFKRDNNTSSIKDLCGSSSFKTNVIETAPASPVSSSSVSSSNGSEIPETPTGIWEIEEIRDYVKDDFGEMYYVKWKDWSDDFNTWEPRFNLLNCDEELYRFYQVRKEKYKTALEKSEYVLLSNGKRRRIGLALPVLPPDPRPYDIRVQNFFNVTGCMLEENNIWDVYTQWKSQNIKANSRWSQSKIDKRLEEATDGLLSDDELEALKKQIIILEVEEKHTALKIEIKDWEEKINTITGGKPYITVENDFDLSRPPISFQFVNEYVAGEGVVIPTVPPMGCQCTSNGTSCCYDERNKKCCSVQSGCKFAYTRFGKVNVMLGSPIYECNSKCACGPNCSNRVVQDGKSDNKFCIFRTNDGRGWGVKTLQKIKKGSFVTLYLGEVIKSEEAERRGRIYDSNGQTYLFDLDFNDSEDCPFSVDAAAYGNVAHFINHSCSPNLGVYSVWVNCLDPNLPLLAMFALKDISRDEELTFDYDVKLSGSRLSVDQHQQEESNGDIPSMKTRCLCGTPKCRKFIFRN